MWLVTTALRRPITVLVLVIAAMLTGLLAIERMPRDVFPNLGVPVLYVAQPYGGLDPTQMEGSSSTTSSTSSSTSPASSMSKANRSRA